MSDNLQIAGRQFRSRLVVGTGKYRTFQEMQRCHEASGAEMVTVAGLNPGEVASTVMLSADLAD